MNKIISLQDHKVKKIESAIAPGITAGKAKLAEIENEIASERIVFDLIARGINDFESVVDALCDADVITSPNETILEMLSFRASCEASNDEEAELAKNWLVDLLVGHFEFNLNQ